MRDQPPRSLLLRCLTLVLAGLLALAFATGTIGAKVPDSASLRLETLKLMGLTDGDLCDNAHGQPHEHAPECGFCIAFASPPLPAQTVREVEARYSALVLLPQLRLAILHRQDKATPLRGPPAMRMAA